jgi:hypothetical protein
MHITKLTLTTPARTRPVHPLKKIAKITINIFLKKKKITFSIIDDCIGRNIPFNK